VREEREAQVGGGGRGKALVLMGEFDTRKDECRKF
jgi:hypothetical protein